MLSPVTAHLLALLCSLLYVGSIYATRANASSLGRDHPDVIRARLTAVVVASILCCALVSAVLIYYERITQWDVLARFGLTRGLQITSWHALRPHLIAPVLFLGPLYATSLGGTLPFQRHWSYDLHVRRTFFTWQGMRNVIIAPPTEEIVFRSCILSLLHVAAVPRSQLVFLSPLSFGLAHVHHAWEIFNRFGRTRQAALQALTTILFQLTYTTLFGCYTAYLFLRTSSFYPPLSAHMFCNFMGFPQIAYEMRVFPRYKFGAAIGLMYVLGIIGFVYTLPRWTDTPGSFYWA